MTVKKRGLGRGLEALLVDVPDSTNQHALAPTLIKALQDENRRLLQEAWALQELLNEFEAMVRRFGSNE